MRIFKRKRILIIAVSFVLTIVVGCWYSSQSNSSGVVTPQLDTPALELPIDCELGQDCFVLHYPDIDTSPQAVDFGCGRQTYDGHKGTDFGISSLEAMKAGVPVVAAAAGTVLRVRDGVRDRLVSSERQKVEIEATGEECGNGLVIDHGNNWETQYCHLQQGSIKVVPNTEVKPGTVLGMVGASGLASFPHVHLSIRHQGEIIDPFLGKNVGEADCKTEGDYLWSKSLAYVSTGLIRAGFSSQPPKQIELWEGKYSDHQLSVDSPALIFWVHAYGVLKGDREHWQLMNPTGETVLDQEQNLDKSYRSWVSYAGKRKFTTGTWQGKYELIRDNRAVFSVEREILLN